MDDRCHSRDGLLMTKEEFEALPLTIQRKVSTFYLFVVLLTRRQDSICFCGTSIGMIEDGLECECRTILCRRAGQSWLVDGYQYQVMIDDSANLGRGSVTLIQHRNCVIELSKLERRRTRHGGYMKFDIRKRCKCSSCPCMRLLHACFVVSQILRCVGPGAEWHSRLV